MFTIKPTNQTYSDPVSATFLPGIPFGREYSRGDMCFYHTEIPSSKIFLNSKVLRMAILDNLEYVQETLNLTIIDNDRVSEDTKVKVTKPKQDKSVKKPGSMILETKDLPSVEDHTGEIDADIPEEKDIESIDKEIETVETLEDISEDEESEEQTIE